MSCEFCTKNDHTNSKCPIFDTEISCKFCTKNNHLELKCPIRKFPKEILFYKTIGRSLTQRSSLAGFYTDGVDYWVDIIKKDNSRRSNISREISLLAVSCAGMKDNIFKIEQFRNKMLCLYRAKILQQQSNNYLIKDLIGIVCKYIIPEVEIKDLEHKKILVITG